MKGTEALSRFVDILLGADERSRIHAGASWRPETGWRVYVSVNDHMLRMGAREARYFCGLIEARARKLALPTGHVMRLLPPDLRTLAKEVGQKNTAGEKPAGHEVVAGHEVYGRA